MEFNILFFLLGLQLMLLLIASLYRIIDLWYRIGDFLLPLARSVIFYSLMIIVLWCYLEDAKERAFLWGCLFFLCFHVSIFWIGQVFFRIKRWRRGSAK